MIRRFTFASLAIVPALVLAPRLAHAGLEACNNIDVRANASCKVEVEGGCTAQCTPVSVEAACAGKLTATCDGECSADVDIDCRATCQGSCSGKCSATEGKLDCRGDCTASCDADCDGQCAGSANASGGTASCKVKCQANCGAKCDVQCDATAPTATCEGKCNASCEGSCKAKASAKCQIDCQAKLEGSCKVEIEGGCKARCQKPEGALFCDGQYVDTGNNLQSCIDALRETLNIQVSGSASAECSGNNCTAEAEGTASCTTSPRTAPVLPGLALFAMIGATIARKVRRGRR